MSKSLFGFLIALIWLPALALGQQTIDHRLDVTIAPTRGTLHAIDELTLPPPLRGRPVAFELHPALRIVAVEGGQVTTDAPGHHILRPDDGRKSLTLEYRGRIQHALRDISDAAGKTQHSTPGLIDENGVFLGAASRWYPRIGEYPLRFDLDVELPDGWLAVSQGKAERANHWSENRPQQEIVLVAGPYTRYTDDRGPVTAEVYLRRPDPELARRYLTATGEYIRHYDALLGPYPYDKFALVENFWESGYGLPSFTLLGPTVIRLPFIIHTSYPHEIVHNWFGNGVHVDWEQGNWSEGLTTDLADHHLREQRGDAASYRRDQLKNWADHAGGGRDFPLRAFTGRHGDTSQAVGYGKAMMFFHMVRQRIGDDAFFRGLKTFVAAEMFRRASYDDLRRHWERAAGTDLKDFFDAWLERRGAPRLALEETRVETGAEGHRLHATLRQTQSEAPFPLTVPVRIEFGDKAPAVTLQIPMHKRHAKIQRDFDHRPTRITVDPDFDCFRQLYPEENPLTLSSFFGDERIVVVLPAAAPKRRLARYRQLAENWAAKRSGKWKIVRDDQLDGRPKDGKWIVLGWRNRLARTLGDGPDTLGGQNIDRQRDSVVMTRKNATGARILFIASEDPNAIDALARKLPHYGKYSYLLFQGSKAKVSVKGQWPVSDSPLSHRL